MNRTKISVILILLMGGLLIACQAPAPEEEPPATEEAAVVAPSLTPEQVRKVADLDKAVKADPDRTAEILEEAGVTADEYEDLQYQIAEDPELTRLYRQAMALD